MGWIKLALLFHTVSVVNAQTCLNGYYFTPHVEKSNNKSY